MLTVGRDTIVVAASAGGVEALRVLLGTLPAELPAAVLVAPHLPPRDGGGLAGVLDRAGPLKAVPAEDAATVEHGHVYVARPGHHLLVHDGRIRLSHGPRHHGHRPAADPLFISAALDAGVRVAGVVLSGALDDGARGCVAVEGRGGAVAVQDPAEAAFPGMPSAALEAVPNAAVLPVRELAGWLVRQTRTPVITEGEADDAEIRREISRLLPGPDPAEPDGALAGLGCPECGGAMYERAGHYVCRVGHAWSGESFVDAQSDAVERALWVAVQRLEERVRILDRMAGRRFAAREEAARAREALDTIRVLQVQVGGGDGGVPAR